MLVLAFQKPLYQNENYMQRSTFDYKWRSFFFPAPFARYFDDVCHIFCSSKYTVNRMLCGKYNIQVRHNSWSDSQLV